MVNVGILGATGYTALELMRIIVNHPEIKLTAVTSRQAGSPHISTIHPSLIGRIDICCEDLKPTQVADLAQYVFCALPHAASMAVVPEYVAAGCRVIDLSADYRLNDPAVYAQQFYASLRALDRLELKSILIEMPPATRDWDAVRDRIWRATKPK